MISLQDIEAARRRIRDAIYTTPCAHSEYFTRRLGARTFFKLENLQLTGSFKERGALNRLLTLSEDERGRGLITASAGNHAQAVAYHATRLGLPATVVMPKRTPLVKVANTRDYGAEVVLEGDNFDVAVAHARKLQQERNLVFVHPFDDEQVIAGQGTLGLELHEQQPDLDLILVPIGGGGLISGTAIAYKSLHPSARIVGVQAAAIPSMKNSRDQGQRLTLPPAQTIADGIAVKQPGALTLEIVRHWVDDIVTVTEEEIANAVLQLLEREKTVAEGAAATVLAAIANGHVSLRSGKTTAKTVCLVLSGGNIDVNLLSRIIEQGLSKDGRLVRLEAKVSDRPGSLARLLQLVAEAECNVIEVHHQRAFAVPLGEVFVELVLETRGHEHVQQLLASFAERGVAVARL